jgi:hypothetical protein
MRKLVKTYECGTRSTNECKESDNYYQSKYPATWTESFDLDNHSVTTHIPVHILLIFIFN